MKWNRYSIRIDRKGEVTLRTPAGRAIGWHPAAQDSDAAASEWRDTFRGAVIDDRRTRLSPSPSDGGIATTQYITANT